MSATSLASIHPASLNIVAPKTRRHFSHASKQSLQLALHTTLEIPALLNIFLEQVNELIGLHGIHYRHDKLRLYHQCGKRQGSAKEYELNQGKINLGEITLYHRVGFTSDELIKLKEILPLLANPLSNALQYANMQQGAMIDPLTALPNRAAFSERLSRETHLAKRHCLPLSILSVDIDHFKSVNDTFGHHAGDTYLTAFATGLSNTCRESDSCFRLGGEEFVILCPKTDVSGAIILAERMRRAITYLCVPYANQTLSTTISVGVAGYLYDEKITTLMAKADQALYRAKHQGRDKVCS